MSEEQNDIEKILAERAKLDELLRTQFTKKITVMFTDIKGSTSFYEQRGDVDGRLMVHRHNEQVLPVIARNRGVLIKTIGDATLSIYEDASDGVRAAQQVQQALREYNAGQPAERQINVRIGLNTGLGIVEKQDVFGDVVNTASRVEALADAGEVLVTEDLYREVRSSDEFIFRYFDEAKLKGKKTPIRAYRLVWHEEELSLGKTRSGMQVPRTRDAVVVLDASVSGRNIRLSVSTRKDGEERAVKNYREVPYDAEKVREYTKAIIAVLNSASRRGKIGNDLLVQLKEQGSLLFDQLLPIEIKDMLKQTKENCLLVSIDDNLVHIPWELLYDGNDFLCLRFSMGRSVSTRQAVTSAVRLLQRPLKMQVLADPRGDLQAAYEEGVAIKNEIGGYEDWIDISLKTTDISADYAKSKIRNFDIVHYAGHAEHDADAPGESGWLMKDGRLNAAGILAMAGSRPMPALVFSNACQSGRTDAWKLDADYGTRIFGLANAFLLAGVQHYIGTFWEIPDEAGALFARSFYRSLAAGASIGSAMRAARQSIVRAYGEDTIVWASYMLYGDPSTLYVAPEPGAASLASPAETQAHEPSAAAGMRGPGQRPERKSRAMLILGATTAILIAAGLAAFLFLGKGRGPTAPIERQSVTADEKKNEPATGRGKRDSARSADRTLKAAEDYKARIENKGIKFKVESFYTALKNDNAEVAELFIKAGIDLNTIPEGEKDPALILAIRKGNVQTVSLMIKAGADLNVANWFGVTPLYAAAELGQAGVMAELIAKGATVKTTGSDTLVIASRWGHEAAVKVLLNAGMDGKGEYGTKALSQAADYGHLPVVKLLVEKGADVNARDPSGYTPLARAAEANEKDIALFLLDKGADRNGRDNFEMTPLLRAAQRDHADMVKLLIEKGADINAKNKNGETAVLTAVKENNPEVLKVLVAAKADINIPDKDGKTALFLAKNRNRQKLVDILEGK